MKPQNLLAAILLCAATSLAHAIEENTPLEILIVTGTRIPQPLKQALSHSTVITEQDIKASQAADVPTLLRSLAGVEVVQGGGLGKQSSIFMRGTNSSHVLVLLDGVRINSATTGTTAIDQLMLDQIERIEVVRGNVSSLYGSEAIGGVIQIFTKRGKGTPKFSIRSGMGSQNSQHIATGIGGETGSAAFNAQVSKYETSGVSAINPSIVSNVNPDKDGYSNISVSTNVSYAFDIDQHLLASIFDSRGEAQTDNSFGSSTDVNSSTSHIQKLALISDNRISETWQSKLQLAQGTDDTQNFLNGVPDIALGAVFKTTGNQVAWQNTLRWDAQNEINIGLENLAQRVTSSTAFTRDKRTANSLFAGYTASHGVHQVQLNLRQDRYSDFGTANSSLLSYGFAISDAWRSSASVSTAFKAPTMNDLFYPFTDFGFGFTYRGNPDLKPERARNTELGIHYTTGAQSIDVAYFDNRTRDLIVNNGLAASSMINLAEARSNGFELAYTGQFGDTGVKAALTQQNPRDAITGQVLVRRAKSYGNFSVTQAAGAWKVSGELQYSGSREDYDINTFSRITLNSYNVANLTTSYAVNKQFKLSMRADNLFNRDYFLMHGFSTSGRTLFISLNFQS